MSSDNTSEIFGKIYRERGWHSGESVSGWGSELRNTERVIRELPGFLRRHGITSMLDAPCGDFNWMRHVDLSGIDYTGADIVPELVAANQTAYGGPGRRFQTLNLIEDRLPQADLILCRDCLFHFSHADVFRALENCAASGARYLLTTTFLYRTYPRNGDIQTGQWTPINLEMPPYELAPPIALLIEGSTEGIFYGEEVGVVPQSDRCLGLWHMDAVRDAVARRAESGPAAR